MDANDHDVVFNVTFQQEGKKDNVSSDCTHVGNSWEFRGAAAIPCLLLTLIFVAELLCHHRAYKTTLQRLILYYTLLSFVYLTFTSVNAIAQNHQESSSHWLESMVMYFANAVFIVPAIIINFLMFMIMRLCCGFHIKYPPSKRYTVLTELGCVGLGLVLSLILVPFNAILNMHLSFDALYTVHATRCSVESDINSVSVQVSVAVVIISEMVVAVIVLNVAHCKIRLHVKGQKVLQLERKTHVIVIVVALIYAIGIPVSFGLTYIKEEYAMILLAFWFPLLNQCNVITLCVTSIRTTNDPFSCLQRKNEHWNRQNTVHHKTNPTSHPLNQPSHTTFKPPYTDAFTSHDSNVASGVSQDSGVGEMSPLLVAGRHHFTRFSDTRVDSTAEL